MTYNKIPESSVWHELFQLLHCILFLMSLLPPLAIFLILMILHSFLYSTPSEAVTVPGNLLVVVALGKI